MSTNEILGWAAQIIKAVVDAIREAAVGAEPPALAELQAKVHAAVDARSAAWLKQAQAEADAALARAAADAFDPKP
jgi:hypothetical protein